MKAFGTMETVPQIEVGIDTVYIRTNVIKTEMNGIVGWEYDEVQIPVADFIARLQNEKDVLQEEVYVLQEVTFDAVTESESTKAELLVLQELVFDLIVGQEGAV